MGIIKVMVDGVEKELVTALDDEEVELNCKVNLDDDTIDLGEIVNEIKDIELRVNEFNE